MLDQQKGEFVVECDACGDTLETGVSNFDAARNVMRRQGWRPTKEGEEWKHYCRKCR